MENIDRKTLGDLAREAFGETVKTLRQGRGLTQAQLAAELAGMGVSGNQTTIAKIERGDRPTSVSEAAVIANFFAVPIQALFPFDITSTGLNRLAVLMNRFEKEIADRDALVYQLEAIRAKVADILDEWDVNVKDVRADKDALEAMGLNPQTSWENGMRDRADLPADLAAAVWVGIPPEERKNEAGDRDGE